MHRFFAALTTLLLAHAAPTRRCGPKHPHPGGE